MLIEKLRVQNFLSFADATFQLGDTGLLLISGHNGAGKSSISSKAITWGLFGDTPAGVRGDDVVGIAAPKELTSVEIWFSVQGRPWKITRTRNPGRLVVTNLEDGQETSFRNLSETQGFIANLIGRDLDSFMASDYFGQDHGRRFLEQTPGTQQSIVEEILRVDARVTPLIDASRAKIESLAAAQEGEQEQLQILRGSRLEVERQLTQLREQRETAATAYTNVSTEPEPRVREVSDVGEPPAIVEPQAPTEIPDPEPPVIVDPAECFVRLNELQETVEHHRLNVANTQESVTEARKHERTAADSLASLRTQEASLHPQIREISEDSCPECGQTVGAEKTAALKAQVAQASAQLAEVQNWIATMEVTKEDWHRVLVKRQDNLTRLQGLLDTTERQVRQVQAEIQRVTRAKAEYEEQVRDTRARRERARIAYEEAKQAAEGRYRALMEKYEQARAGVAVERARAQYEYESAVKDREARIGAAQARVEEFDALIRDLGRRLETQALEISTLEASIFRLARAQVRAGFWLDTFRHAFKRYMLEQSLPFLNERVAYHLTLLGNPQINVEFSTTKVLKSGDERGAFSVRASTNFGGQAYGSLSGGERQIASFAVGLALSELADAQSGSSNEFLILDEPFTELDPRNCSNVIHYISTELVKRKRSVLLVSNDPNLRQLVANRVEVVKDATGISHLTAE